MAAFVKDGNDVSAAARRWGVCPATVEAACRMHKVPFEKFNASAKTDNLLRIVAALCKGVDTQSEISRIAYVPRQYVLQVKKRCKLAGIPVASRYK